MLVAIRHDFYRLDCSSLPIKDHPNNKRLAITGVLVQSLDFLIEEVFQLVRVPTFMILQFEFDELWSNFFKFYYLSLGVLSPGVTFSPQEVGWFLNTFPIGVEDLFHPSSGALVRSENLLI